MADTDTEIIETDDDIQPLDDGPQPVVVESGASLEEQGAADPAPLSDAPWITVQVGIDHAMEPFRQGESEEVRYRRAPGQRTCTLRVPSDRTLEDAAKEVIVALRSWIEPDAKPVWITAEHGSLQMALLNYYDLKEAHSQRPAAWGDKVQAPEQAENAE
jgi:hypothetical protein